MKTIRTHSTLTDAAKELQHKFDALAILAESNLIKFDADIEITKVKKDVQFLKKEKCTPTEKYPYAYYFAARSHGVEGAESKQGVLARVADFHTNPIATAAISWDGKEFKTMFNLLIQEA